MLPQDALDWLRAVFAACDRELSFRLSKAPNSHEPSLDQLLISKLQDYPCYSVLPSQTTVTIDTHFLGGRAMFYNWEVADIGILVMFRVRGEFAFSKVVLLQSKRLYPQEAERSDDLRLMFQAGLARLFPSEEAYGARMRTFSFVEASRYLAIEAEDNQLAVIRQYQNQRRIPVYYLLYNPFRVPWSVAVPLVSPPPVEGNVEVGTRVVSSDTIFAACDRLSKGQSPSLSLIRSVLADAKFSDGLDGWPLPDFIVAHVLQCREGRIVNATDGGDLFQLFYNRSGPISAGISITIDVPDADLLPSDRPQLDGDHEQLPP